MYTNTVHILIESIECSNLNIIDASTGQLRKFKFKALRNDRRLFYIILLRIITKYWVSSLQFINMFLSTWFKFSITQIHQLVAFKQLHSPQIIMSNCVQSEDLQIVECDQLHLTFVDPLVLTNRTDHCHFFFYQSYSNAKRNTLQISRWTCIFSSVVYIYILVCSLRELPIVEMKLLLSVDLKAMTLFGV